MSWNTSGPAFTSAGGVANDGMSLRDWFAGQALVALIITNELSRAKQPLWSISLEAYKHGDAMLTERGKTHNG